MANFSRAATQLFLFVAGATFAANAPAAIVSGTVTGGTISSTSPAGQFIQLDPDAGPFDVGNNSFGTNNLYGFNEQQNVSLLSDLTVFLGEGRGLGAVVAGTPVSSQFFAFDTVALETVAATLVFDQPILGFARSAAQLAASNSLGAAQVTYLSPPFVGLEGGLDFITFNPLTPNQVKISLRNDSPGDVFRVFTAGVPGIGGPGSAVPEPAAWAMMIAGFLLVGRSIRRKRRFGTFVTA